MVSRIQIAKPDILKTFEKLPHVLTARDVATAFDTNRDFWRLTKSTSLRSFTEFMTEKTPLALVTFPFPQRKVSGFTWGDVPLLEVLLGLVENSFYSHYTAVRIHGLTEQVPKTIFLNHEKPASSTAYERRASDFDQSAIDAAFKKQPRASQNELVRGDLRILFLQSAYQAGLGITAGAVDYGDDRNLQLRYSNLERTLIDIAVRPFYSGGVFEVAKAFEKARDLVSVNTMASMLKRMDFAYPYHQAIGYYLERAGYKSSLLDLFRQQPAQRDFYLTHAMNKTRYMKQWRLFVPDGF